MPPKPDRTWHREPGARALAGLDVFIESGQEAGPLADRLQADCQDSAFTLRSISNRGVQVWPAGGGETFLVDHFHCRFMLNQPLADDGNTEIVDLLSRIGRNHRWMHVEKLQRFDGQDGFAKAQGEG
jgi:isocitrate dehydrogenase